MSARKHNTAAAEAPSPTGHEYDFEDLGRATLICLRCRDHRIHVALAGERRPGVLRELFVRGELRGVARNEAEDAA